MPYRQQKFVSVMSHDQDTWDVNVSFRNAVVSIRYTVLVPKRSSNDAIYKAAIGLAMLVRLEQQTDTIFVRRDMIVKSIQSAAVRARAEAMYAQRELERNAGREQVILGVPAQPPRHVPEYQKRQPMAPNALQVAEELLRGIDSDLHAKVKKGTAFYFTTPSRRYIWYPNSRAIVSLDDDMPRYVCVHSQDTAVESNTYDWALTMRTYLLANEEHWRAKAFFHNEYSLRGDRKSYEDLPAGPHRGES